MLFRVMGQLGELNADSVALAVAHHTDGTDLGILHVDRELQAHSCSQVACCFDEAAAEAHIRAHPPTGGSAKCRLHARSRSHRLALRITTLGAVLEITDAVRISLRLVDPLRREAIDWMRGEADAPIGRDVPLHLHSDMANKRRVVPAHPHYRAAVFLASDGEPTRLSRF